MPKMRAAQVARPGEPFEIVEREIPEPGAGWVRIRVQACGICHSDVMVKDGNPARLQYPRVPGHEVIGVIDAVGKGDTGWKEGQRVGVGWHAGHCGHCDACRSGDFFGCKVQLLTTGLSFDGGYAEYMVAPAIGVAAVPDDLDPVAAAPLMCAGITTYNALRNSGARAGDVVAVQGLGGLGHLGVQYAAQMGFKTVGIARGQDKEALARQLGAHYYIDSQAQDPAAELQKLGGAKAILTTVTDASAMATMQGGLGLNGTLMIVGVSDSIQISPALLIFGRRAVKGWYSGTARDSEDTLKFSALTGVKSMNEVYPLDRVEEAYDRMISGKARFRVVLKMEQ
jgi:D-arabinose 1-dehydrogenase-like Zn-dependent alcohol dehydrogenase